MYLLDTTFGFDLAITLLTNSRAPFLNSGFKDSKSSSSIWASQLSSAIGQIRVTQSLSIKYLVIASLTLFFLYMSSVYPGSNLRHSSKYSLGVLPSRSR